MSVQQNHDGIYWRKIPARSPGASRATLLFLHGLGESGLCFERLVKRPELADFERWIPDLPNYGRSRPVHPPPRLNDLANLIRSWLEQAPSPVILVGHSMGGVLGQLVCERHSVPLGGFVNVEGNLSLDDCAFSGPAARLSLQEFLGGGFDRLLDDVYRGGLESPPLRGYYASLRLAVREQFHLHSQELVEMSAREDLADRFARLRLPVKIYVGGLSGGVGARSRLLLDRAGVDWRGFENSGHWPFLDEEDRFVRMIGGVVRL